MYTCLERCLVELVTSSEAVVKQVLEQQHGVPATDHGQICQSLKTHEKLEREASSGKKCYAEKCVKHFPVFLSKPKTGLDLLMFLIVHCFQKRNI